MGTRWVFRLVFLKNEVLKEKILFFFLLFLYVESPHDRSYHNFGNTLYVPSFYILYKIVN